MQLQSCWPALASAICESCCRRAAGSGRHLWAHVHTSSLREEEVMLLWWWKFCRIKEKFIINNNESITCHGSVRINCGTSIGFKQSFQQAFLDFLLVPFLWLSKYFERGWRADGKGTWGSCTFGVFWPFFMFSLSTRGRSSLGCCWWEGTAGHTARWCNQRWMEGSCTWAPALDGCYPNQLGLKLFSWFFIVFQRF